MPRTPRNRRVLGFPRIILQERDREIILAVYGNRFLRRDQIERLFFTTTSACNQRLIGLYQNHLLDRLYLPVDIGSSQAVYALDKLGAHVVAHHHRVPHTRINWKRRHNKVEYFFLEHTVMVSEVHVALELALREKSDAELLSWRREAFLAKERLVDPDDCDMKLIVASDAFFGLETKEGKSFFFVEVDMGTETLERFRQKLVAYRHYWKSGAYQERYSHKNFRVLTVATGSERTNNLIKVAESVGARNMFLFATAEKMSKNILGPIWYRPITLDPTSILD